MPPEHIGPKQGLKKGLGASEIQAERKLSPAEAIPALHRHSLDILGVWAGSQDPDADTGLLSQAGLPPLCPSTWNNSFAFNRNKCSCLLLSALRVAMT